MNPIPKSSEYFFDGQCFRLRSKWHKVAKAVISGVIVVSGLLTYQVTESHSGKYSVAVQKVTKETVFAEYIKGTNPRVSDSDAGQIAKSIVKWADKFQLDPSLLVSLAKVESAFDKYAISPMGAVGILQVLPSAHINKMIAAKKNLGNPELFDVDTNIYLGAWVIRDCLNKYDKLSNGLKCYNGSVNLKTTYDKDVIAVYDYVKRIAKI